MSRDTLVILPVKDPARAKSRLAEALDPPRRADLARHLFARSLDTLLHLQPDLGFDLGVVTTSPEVARTAEAAGAALIEDPGHGLNAALEAAAEFARARGCARLCVLPADLSAPAPEDLARVIGFATSDRTVLICPATDGGTNALRLAPGTMPFQFGPDSARRHAEAAERAGLTPVILPLASLADDIDTSRDLTRAAETSPDLRGFA